MSQVVATAQVSESRMHAGRSRATEHKALRIDETSMDCALLHPVADVMTPSMSSAIEVVAVSARDDIADAAYSPAWRTESFA
jgi:hypothetical protein